MSAGDSMIRRVVLRPRRAGQLLLLVICAFFTFPIYWMVKVSVEPREYLLDPALIPRGLTTDNYAGLIDSPNFGYYLANSIIVAVGSTVLSVVLATLAGYGLARFNFPGRRAMARSILFIYMFPALALAVPLFIFFGDIGLRNSWFGLIVAHSTISIPLGTWLIWQYFQTIPTSYSESAYVLGASRLRTFLEVELPQARSGIVAITIFAFAASWEDYEFAFTLTTATLAKTLPVAASSFVETDVINWGLIQGTAVIMAIPPLLIVLFLQRYLIKGLGSGGIK